jgi:hypothetical protein
MFCNLYFRSRCSNAAGSERSTSCYASTYEIDNDRFLWYIVKYVDLFKLRGEPVSGGSAAFAAFALTEGKQRKTAKEQRASRCFFRSPDRQRPRFSATNEMPLADNFWEEQQKQREWPLRLRHPLTLLTRAALALPSTHPVAVPAKAGTDRPAARAAERWTPAFAGAASNIVRPHEPPCFFRGAAQASAACGENFCR